MEIDNRTGEVLNEAAPAFVPFLRSAYNYDRDLVSEATGLICPDPSRTQQSFAEEVNINTIVQRFGLTGELPSDLRVPQSGDFLDVPDFQTALNLVIESEKAFQAMPADVRKRFANDLAEFMAFVHDEKNRDEAKKLGLLMPDPVPVEPALVRVVADPAVPVVPGAPAPKTSST